MTMSFKVEITANGEVVEGDSTILSMDRENTIEGLFFENAIATARERGSGLATGRRRHEPCKMHKRVCKASPVLARALCNNEVITAKMTFYYPNPAGDGTTNELYIILLEEARISSLQYVSSDALDPASADSPMMEVVEIVYGKITWEHVPSTKVHTDDWKHEA